MRVLIGDLLWSSYTKSVRGRKVTKWKVEENEASTRACLDLVGCAENLVGIFCGHVHFDHVDRVHDGCYQYVTQPCFEGAHRTIRLAPLD